MTTQSTSEDISNLGNASDINYLSLFVENEQQLPLWTERQIMDEDFDLENQDILLPTIQNQNISVRDYLSQLIKPKSGPSEERCVYIGTDPISGQISMSCIHYEPSTKYSKPEKVSKDGNKSDEIQKIVHTEEDFRIGTKLGVVSKACVIRRLTEDKIGQEMYQLMLCWTVCDKYKEYCVSQQKDRLSWYLFIDNFIYFTDQNQLKNVINKVEDSNSLFLTCSDSTHFELTFMKRWALRYSVPINTVIPYLCDGVLQLGIHIKPKGVNDHRKWWYSTKPESDDSGIVELEANGYYETQLSCGTRKKRSPYFCLFLYKNAKLVMRDFFGDKFANTHCTLFLDGTVIMIEGLFRVGNIHQYSYRYSLTDLKNAKAIKLDVSEHPVIFLRDISTNISGKLWEIFVDKVIFGGDVRKKRFIYFNISDVNDIKSMDYLDWNDGQQYIRYYQSTRIWSNTIVIAPNHSPSQPYIGTQQPNFEPMPLSSGIQSNLWDQDFVRKINTRRE